MQKQPKIRWTKSQREKLAKSVSKFNAKITRELKKNPLLSEFLPQRLSVKVLKEKITSAKDLNNLVKSTNRAFKKDAFLPITSDTGIKTTKYEKREIQIKVNKINQARKKERERADVSTEKGTMGTIKSNNLRPKEFNINKIKKSDWEHFVAGVEKQTMGTYNQEKIETYKKNYLNAIVENLGYAGEELYKLIESIDPKVLYENFYDDPILQIGFISDPLPVESIAENTMTHWLSALGK